MQPEKRLRGHREFARTREPERRDQKVGPGEVGFVSEKDGEEDEVKESGFACLSYWFCSKA